MNFLKSEEIQFDEILKSLKKESLMEKYLDEMILFKKYVYNLSNVSDDLIGVPQFKNAREENRIKEMVEDIFEDIDL
jgi:hypothetical protein